MINVELLYDNAMLAVNFQQAKDLEFATYSLGPIRQLRV